MLKKFLFAFLTLFTISSYANFSCMTYGDMDSCTGAGCSWTIPWECPPPQASCSYCWGATIIGGGSQNDNLARFLAGNIKFDELSTKDKSALKELVEVRNHLSASNYPGIKTELLQSNQITDDSVSKEIQLEE
jgi:hypothetical protein